MARHVLAQSPRIELAARPLGPLRECLGFLERVIGDGYRRLHTHSITEYYRRSYWVSWASGHWKRNRTPRGAGCSVWGHGGLNCSYRGQARDIERGAAEVDAYEILRRAYVGQGDCDIAGPNDIEAFMPELFRRADSRLAAMGFSPLGYLFTKSVLRWGAGASRRRGDSVRVHEPRRNHRAPDGGWSLLSRPADLDYVRDLPWRRSCAVDARRQRVHAAPHPARPRSPFSRADTRGAVRGSHRGAPKVPRRRKRSRDARGAGDTRSRRPSVQARGAGGDGVARNGS